MAATHCRFYWTYSREACIEADCEADKLDMGTTWSKLPAVGLSTTLHSSEVYTSKVRHQFCSFPLRLLDR